MIRTEVIMNYAHITNIGQHVEQDVGVFGWYARGPLRSLLLP